MARFFIDRPVFAWVIALFIVLGGMFAIRALPVAQYPDIAPPVVSLYATYPGASAQVVEESVTALIEREMNGVPGLLSTSATSSAGSASLDLTFRQGMDVGLAAVEVQNRLKAVEARLPEPVRRDGIQVEKAAGGIQLVVSLTSEDGRMNAVQLGEYASTNVLQALRRVEGVGKVQFWGAEHAMRIWLDPLKLAGHGLSVSDVTAAVQAHNARLTIGDIGRNAVPESVPIAATVFFDSPLRTAADFGGIALRTQGDGSALSLRDVARIEVGANDYNYPSYVNGKVATGMGIRLAPGSNAVETERRIRSTMDKLSASFPPGVKYQIPFETSSFVRASMNRVVTTLAEAGILVFLVTYLFMQNLRAALIPTIVVPVALAGTFGVMLAAGFSINVLTMFGMVLAIGILVDDAIVVVENVERLMSDEGLGPYEATKKAMGQISGAIVGITAVLTSVFVPMAFSSGVVGNIYRQFALALAVSIGFSAFLALSLTPALCATLLRPIKHGRQDGRNFFVRFNRCFQRLTQRYLVHVDSALRRPMRWLAIFLALAAAAVVILTQLPSSFVPEEDQGNFMVMVIRPPGTPLTETIQSLRKVEEYVRTEEPVAYTYMLGGFNLHGEGPNGGMIFVTLKDWATRKHAADGIEPIIARINGRFATMPNTMVLAMNSPALPGLGSTSGFDFRLQNRGGLDYRAFSAARETLLEVGRKDPVLRNVTFAGAEDSPQLRLEINRKKAAALGVSMSEVNTTLAVMFGSSYIGDFMHGTQVRRVIAQADGHHRITADDVKKLCVRNQHGEMVPLAAFATLQWIAGPPQLTRYNGFPSFSINGSAAHGHSSGEAMAAIERIAASLPAGIGYEWSGQSVEEQQSASQAPVLFALSVLVVFLTLAALYESWSVPLAVMLIVPLGMLGTVLGVSLRMMPNDIYFKVGLITTIGLSAKNAILIVEVAKARVAQGVSMTDAALEAARLRLRPIVMTSLAFGVGVLPLAFASGASSAAQRAIGTSVLGGVISATVLAVIFVPLFFVTVGRWFLGGSCRRRNVQPPVMEGPAESDL
jgi:multidrug efflux pump